MSDQQDKNTEQQAQETAAAGENMQASAEPGDTVATTPVPADPVPATAAPAAKGSSGVAWLALLVALAGAAGLGWSIWEQRQQSPDPEVAGITARLQALEASAGREIPDLDAATRQWQAQLETALQEIKSGSGDLENQTRELAQALATVEARMSEQSEELTRYGANDREDWLLAEVQYLLRMANQQLLMANDADAAQALLNSADKILLDLDDVRLHDVRAAVATDLAEVRAIARVDVEGLYLRLAALVDQAGKLAIFELPEIEARPAPAPADDWQARLRQGYEAALAKLSDYIIIRRRDEPMQALMDPQWEGLVRQNLRMLLEQAQIALLSGNQPLYRDSLERAQHWVREFFESDEAAARAMSREISTLANADVATTLPDISDSVGAMDAVMKQRQQPAGLE